MSTRRLFLPSASGVIPVWIFGNFGGICLMVVYSSGKILIQSFDFNIGGIRPNLYAAWGVNGMAFATVDPNIMPAPPPGTNEGQAMGMLIGAGGSVNSGLLGTFISQDSQGGTLLLFGVVGGVNQYAKLPDSTAGAIIAGVEHVLAGGFFAYYFKNAGAHPVGSIAMVSVVTGIANALFLGLVIAANSVYTTAGLTPRIKVFSDGNGGYGVYAIGVTLQTQNLFTFSGPASGAGTLVGYKKVTGGTTLTAPLGTYGSTGFNGPFAVNADGSFNSAFASGRFALCPPAKIGGTFMQDSLVLTVAGTPSRSGTLIATLGLGITNISGSVITIEATGFGQTFGTGFAYSFYCEGGSTGGNVTVNFAIGETAIAAATAISAAVGSLFPDCTISFVLTSPSGIPLCTMTVTMPTGATYYPIIMGSYKVFTDGPQTLDPPEYLALNTADGLTNNYFLYDSPGATFTPSPTNVSSALAVNGTMVCHVYGFTDKNSNCQWVITIPGVIRINVSLNYTLGTTHNGNITSSQDWASCPVSIVPFGSGFAIALPYRPVVGGTIVTPLQYTFSPAAASATTILLNGPVIVIDGSGTPNTSFDTAFFANFFSLARTDGVRFGPQGLAVKGGTLYFGSFYTPTYIDLSGGQPGQTDTLGNITPAPVWDPLAAPAPGLAILSIQFPQTLPGLEVLCACDSTAAQILPPP